MVGEYANMTHFITDEDAVSRLETFTSTERVHKVAAFTDGIQRLALNMLDNSPHVPFRQQYQRSAGKLQSVYGEGCERLCNG